MRRKLLVSAVASSLLLLLTACDPPGRPKPEALSPKVLDFPELFAENCAGCHGADGKNGPGRILNDPLYLAILPRDELKQILIHGRPGTAMPAWAISEGGPLSPQQIDVLVDGMEKNWAKPVDFHGAEPPVYSATGKAGDADSGRKLFLRDCFMCHGPGAKIGSVTDASYLSLVSNQMLRTSILVGRPDFGMPDYRFLKAGKPLSDGDVTDLVAFLASKRPAEAEAQMNAMNQPQAGQQAGQTGTHINESGAGENGATSKGNEGSGYGPGSARQQKGEGNKSTGSSSQRGVK